jgi:hypothetical protein
MPVIVDNLLKDSKIQLEKGALDKFGAAVDDFKNGSIPDQTGSGTAPTDPAARKNLVERQLATNRTLQQNSWISSSYAATLAGGSPFRPKLKFMFQVQFNFTQAAIEYHPEIRAKLQDNSFTFMVKSIERPKVELEYEEDVNMYNFRTKVLKRIRHRDLTMTFIDDVGNRIFEFFRILMEIHSPITRGGRLRDGKLGEKPDTSVLSKASGMTFIRDLLKRGANNAHRAVVNSAFGNVIDSIRVKQIYVDPTTGLNDAVRMVTFDFMNPRVVSFDFDDLSHEANDVSQLTMVFDYDWLEMMDAGSLSAAGGAYMDNINVFGPRNMTGVPLDPTPAFMNEGTSSGGNRGPLGSLQKGVSGMVGRYGQKLTSDTIAKGVSTISGGNRFATKLLGQATGSLSGLVSSVITDRTSAGIGQAYGLGNSLTARASSALIKDAATPGDDSAASVVQSSDAYADKTTGNE